MEKELNRKENEIREQLHLQTLLEVASEGKTPESDTLDASTYIETAGKRTDAKVTLNQEITHIIKPFISTFLGLNLFHKKKYVLMTGSLRLTT